MPEMINKTEALAQFNKITKVFTTVLQKVDISWLNNDYYLYKEISIDPVKEKVVGTYDDFQIVAIEDQPLEIKEDGLNALARAKILKKYSIEKQLTIIEKTLEKVATSAGVDFSELREMNEYIDEIKRANRLRKDFYANDSDYDYKSTEDIEQILLLQHEGGIMDYEPKVRVN